MSEEIESQSKYLKIFLEDIFSFRLLYMHKIFKIAPDLEDYENMDFESLDWKDFAEKLTNMILVRIRFMRHYSKSYKKLNDKRDYNLSNLTEEYFNNLKKISIEAFVEIENRQFILILFSEFENYLFKCLKFLYLKDPRGVSSKTLKIGDLINKEKVNLNNKKTLNIDIKSFISEKIENHIENLLRKGYKHTLEEAREDLKIHHQISKRDFRELRFYKDIRNLFAHGDGTIDYNFIRKCKFKLKNYEGIKVGKKFPLDFETILEAFNIIIYTAKAFDKALISAHTELII